MEEMAKLEEAVAGAPNTKKDVKDSSRSLGISIRMMMKHMSLVDKFPSRDRATKCQQQQLQQQQQQQAIQQLQQQIQAQHQTQIEQYNRTQEAIKNIQTAQTNTLAELLKMQEALNETRLQRESRSWATVTAETQKDERKKSNDNIQVEGTSKLLKTDDRNEERSKNLNPSTMSKEMSDKQKHRYKRTTTFVIDPGPSTISDTIKRIKAETDKNTIQDNITRIRSTKNGGILK